jgi:CheY-like chemotaxis protein
MGNIAGKGGLIMSKKILLADDSVTIQKVISITFASEDYELIIVGDGDAAIKKAKDSTPDLVLADVAMPGKNGYEVSEALKNDPATAAIPVMLLPCFRAVGQERGRKGKGRRQHR